jgi:hypothetical protein
MAQRPLGNSKIILPLIVGLIVLVELALYFQFPTWLDAIGGVAVFASIPCVIAFLFVEQSGWRALARRYRAVQPITGAWKTCRTAVLATVALNDPDYGRSKVRLCFIKESWNTMPVYL